METQRADASGVPPILLHGSDGMGTPGRVAMMQATAELEREQRRGL